MRRTTLCRALQLAASPRRLRRADNTLTVMNNRGENKFFIRSRRIVS
jgi:hypothetical protein